MHVQPWASACCSADLGEVTPAGGSCALADGTTYGCTSSGQPCCIPEKPGCAACGVNYFTPSQLYGCRGELWKKDSRLVDFSFAGYAAREVGAGPRPEGLACRARGKLRLLSPAQAECGRACALLAPDEEQEASRDCWRAPRPAGICRAVEPTSWRRAAATKQPPPLAAAALHRSRRRRQEHCTRHKSVLRRCGQRHGR